MNDASIITGLRKQIELLYRHAIVMESRAEDWAKEKAEAEGETNQTHKQVYDELSKMRLGINMLHKEVRDALGLTGTMPNKFEDDVRLLIAKVAKTENAK